MHLRSLDFSSSHPTHHRHHSIRHLSPRAPSHGLGHNTLIVIVVSASVGGLLLTLLIWRIISRLLRPKSAPLPPRQSLVHQRELQLAAFTEYKGAILPQILTNGAGIDVHESDETTLGSSYGIQLHPPSPQFFPPPTPPRGSLSSLPSSNNDSALSLAPASQSSRRGTNPSAPRPLSTFSNSSRHSVVVRGAPHAPHNNVQIVLPAPLAPDLYKGTASDSSPFPRAMTRNSTYSAPDSWRRSLADSWIIVGQDCLPDSETTERKNDHDSIKRPSRLMRRGSSPGPLPPRSRSNPTPPSRLRPSSGLDQQPEGTHLPVPRVPSGVVGRTGGSASLPSTPSRKGKSLTLSPSSTDSHEPRS